MYTTITKIDLRLSAKKKNLNKPVTEIRQLFHIKNFSYQKYENQKLIKSESRKYFFHLEMQKLYSKPIFESERLYKLNVMMSFL